MDDNALSFYPMKTKPCFKDYLWGEKNLRNFNKITDLKIIAESWELSTNENGKSIIANGAYKDMHLSDVISNCPQKFLGNIGIPDLPILVNLIDAEKDFSIQVHPGSKDAGFINSIKEKSEMWYVIDCKPDSYIYCGSNKNTEPNEVIKRAKDGIICEILSKVKVKKGNSFFIPAKTIHVLGSGILVAEIQQNSDSTFRIYDFKRKDKDGNLRPLYLDQAIKVLNYKKTNVDNLKQENLSQFNCNYFKVNNINLFGKKLFTNNRNTFKSLLFLKRSGNIIATE